ncbi:MAG: FAD/NAD(P)-binding oxidoreductase [Actinomycetota bacterium]|nr:FAD/NAD(P)-binding oxidoreductase [Actinomycetota bacterium]
MASSITIVGASLAGVRAAEALRSEGFEGVIKLIGGEAHIPYDRPPLSKSFLEGAMASEKLSLLASEKINELGLEVRTDSKASNLDIGLQTLEVNGEVEKYDALVIATGARARELPNTEKINGVHTLRNLDDSIKIRDSFKSGNPKVVVVGGGFIGCEVASTASTLGLEVTIVESQEVPLSHVLGEEAGRIISELHTNNGVQLKCGVEVQEIRGDSQVEGVLLEDGTLLEADLVIVGIGAVPNTEWLESSGLIIDDGVCCDEQCRVKPGPANIVAAGDVARWDHRGYGKSIRLEHWDNAAEQGKHAALSLIRHHSAVRPYAPIPWFWSDQFDRKIQLAGISSPEDDFEVVVDSPSEGRFTGIYGSEGKLRAVLGINRPRHVMQFKSLMEEEASWEKALDFAKGIG